MAISVTRTAPPTAPANVVAVADHGFEKIYNEESGVLVDRTTEMTNGTSNPTAFAADDDYIYFGVPVLFKNGVSSTTASNRDCRFVDIHVVLDTVASASIVPVFQYSNGDNSWATLTVTDGTNGFTQNGTITFNRASLPSATTWLVATKNGSGATIGDGVARGYVRIQRTANTLTTAPKINSIGTGALSASTTYYYKACHLKISTLSTKTNDSLRSLPSSEVSATTTATARCVKISWDANAGADFQAVWRTPTSGNYVTGADSIYNYEKLNTVATKACDTIPQQVKGTYFNYTSGLTRYQNFVVDNGITIGALYSATYLLYQNYQERTFRSFGRGQIAVTGGTVGTPATFKDIVNADIAGSWGAFTQNNLFSTSIMRSYTCRDNLLLKDFFKDSSFVLDTDSSLLYEGSATTSAVLGRYDTANSNYYQRGGIFIQTGETSNTAYLQFTYTTFYDCLFLDNPIEINATSRSYCQLQFGKENKIYGCAVQANNQYDVVNFNGTNIVINNSSISNARFGLQIDPASMATITTTAITLNGTSGVYTETYTDEGTFTFNQYKFKGVLRPIYNPYAGNKYDHYYHLLDCEFTACDPEDSVIGATSEIYRDWTTELTVLDKNGDPVSGATVNIKDATSTINYDLTTDANGQVSQAVRVAKYTGGTIFNATYGSKYADVITYYTGFVITVSKDGYETFSSPAMDITEPVMEMVKLRPQKKIANVESMTLINADPTNLLDTASYVKV